MENFPIYSWGSKKENGIIPYRETSRYQSIEPIKNLPVF
jgi:hypothetical protein